MPKGTTKGKVDDKFSARIEELENVAVKMAAQFRKADNGFRPWHTPKDTANLLDVATMHMPAWDRYGINQVYSGEVLKGTGKDSGTLGDLIAMKVQNDFMACEERAFRVRHATPVRCAAVMHGRFAGTKPAASIFSKLKRSVDTAIKNGGARDDTYVGE
jgi:hypothetical protein